MKKKTFKTLDRYQFSKTCKPDFKLLKGDKQDHVQAMQLFADDKSGVLGQRILEHHRHEMAHPPHPMEGWSYPSTICYDYSVRPIIQRTQSEKDRLYALLLYTRAQKLPFPKELYWMDPKPKIKDMTDDETH